MTFNLKIFAARLFFLVLFLAPGATQIWANPFEELTPDQKLYQRVKKLGDYGLLDPQDKAVLDQGKIVTRLELAFYTEKAKAKISAPQLGQPLIAPPTPTPQPVLDLMTLPPAIAATPTPERMTLPPAITTTPILPPVTVTPAARDEIDELLKELREESAYLRTRMARDDGRIKAQEDDLETLKPIQDEVDSIWKKSNKSGGIPHFTSKSYSRFENFHLSGIATENVSRAIDETRVEMWTDLGGKGAIDVGFIGQVSASNANGGPVSLSPYAPAMNYLLDGPLGHWDTNLGVEVYKSDTSLGDFTRGISPTAFKRFERPFEIKSFSDDKDTKIWDDYMDAVGFVPAASVGAVQSANDRVFDGLFMIGTNLPLVSADAKMNFMVGRMGLTTTQTQRWEEALKYAQPWAGGKIRTSFATLWVNDNFGVNQIPQVDLKNYSSEISFDLKPFYFNFEGAISHFYTGVDFLNPTNPSPLQGEAGQASVGFYPFTFYYTAISPDYANFQSKVMMAGLNFAQYGQSFSPDHVEDMYGAIGEVDNLISDRYGWRANLGWTGRSNQDWMKGWPAFLDDFIINLDVSQKTEYKTVYSPEGYNVIEPVNMITFFYPDDEGIWGLDFWGGYGGGSSGTYVVRQDYVNNIQAIRNDGNGSFDDARYLFQMSSERIPLVLPVSNEPIQDINGKPVTVTPGVPNSYVNLTQLKSYNYITLTTKLKFNKMFGLDTPLYGSLFFTDNRVSGKATNSTQTDISNMFDQTVYDGALMFQAWKNVNLSLDYGWEVWKSAYTYPLIDYRTDSLGFGFSWDLPWGGSKMVTRYKHLTFQDTYVTSNNYSGDQFFGEFFFYF